MHIRDVDFTREPALTLSGRIPSFAFAEGRTVEIGLNGAVTATVTPDATGAFGAALTLREGPNAIALTADSTFSGNGTGAVTLSGALSGAGVLAKSSTGALVLGEGADVGVDQQIGIDQYHR